ncbi:MAG: hypothetical protein AAGD00_05905 [Planctomycetota bacterium]
MHRIELDPNISRVTLDGFAFPLGAYPVEQMSPLSGYYEEFEVADGGEGDAASSPETSDEWEEWPDRFLFDVSITADRVRSLCRSLFALLPGRVYPILDVLGHDAYREIDPYIAYDPVGVEKFLDAVRWYGEWFFEDGMVGFGAMSVEPFFYVFIDEHKVVTIRVGIDNKERVEKILKAYDLEPVPEIRAADASEHEHRSVLVPRSGDEDLLVADDLIDILRDAWRLELNVDATRNIDDDGRDLGITGWSCLVRCDPEHEAPPVFAEVVLAADSLDAAERLVGEVIERASTEGGATWRGVRVLRAERVRPEKAAELGGVNALPEDNVVLSVRWHNAGEHSSS